MNLEAAFAAIGGIRLKRPGQPTIQSVLLTTKFPASFDEVDKNLSHLDSSASSRIDAAVVVLRHLLAHTLPATRQVAVEEKSNTLIRFAWANLQQNRLDLFHNSDAEYAIKRQIAPKSPKSGNLKSMTCAGLLFSPLMMDTLWKRDEYRLSAAVLCANPDQDAYFDKIYLWSVEGHIQAHYKSLPGVMSTQGFQSIGQQLGATYQLFYMFADCPPLRDVCPEQPLDSATEDCIMKMRTSMHNLRYTVELVAAWDVRQNA